jgi:hypothetical protein
MRRTAIVEGRTDVDNLTNILLNYFPSNLQAHDFDTFCVVCARWLADRGSLEAASDIVAAVLRKMISGAEAIKVANSGSSQARLREGEGWIHSLWPKDGELIRGHGADFRELVHTLAECYCQRAFAGDQTRCRKYLHWSLKDAHRFQNACEQPGCPWLSHECTMDDWTGRGECPLLPEYGADADEPAGRTPISNTSSEQAQSSLPASSTQPSSIRARLDGRIGNLKKGLRRGVPVTRPLDVEQGHTSELNSDKPTTRDKTAAQELDVPVTHSSKADTELSPAIDASNDEHDQTYPIDSDTERQHDEDEEPYDLDPSDSHTPTVPSTSPDQVEVQGPQDISPSAQPSPSTTPPLPRHSSEGESSTLTQLAGEEEDHTDHPAEERTVADAPQAASYRGYIEEPQLSQDGVGVADEASRNSSRLSTDRSMDVAFEVSVEYPDDHAVF